VIVLRNIEKYFEHGPAKTFVLRRVNVDIKEGEFVSIMGPSGAGKSTLLHLIGMHDSAWTGEYCLFDHAVHELKKKERDEIYKKYFGFVFQSYHLLDDLTVYENLDIPLSYRNVKKAERDATVCDTLDRFSNRRQKGPVPEPAFRRPATTGCHRSGHHRQPEGDPRRRAYCQSPLEPSKGDYASVQEAERGRHHDHPGDTFRSERGLRAPDHQDRGRVDRRRLSRVRLRHNLAPPHRESDNRAMAAVVEAIPLAKDAHGVYRVGGTRVTLDLVVRAFNRGATAEEIVQKFTSLQLSDVYQVIGYYLKHSAELAEYFEKREREEKELLAAHPEWAPRGLRERLMARRKTQ
jgi:ABC-type dipeptide/oligopeptide/nickel transport system ATPase component/uncharacterized protein (DUF433 family)